MTNFVPELFGSLSFNDAVMRDRLPKDVYKLLTQTIHEGLDLDISVATVVANAMKDWAIEKGVTHFTHWFQPMTGITAEKHDSFISPQKDGSIIMEFSGKELIKGEPDASSFPSGGLRVTFEARGYTAWDPTSYAFIKDNILCIPTIFCSYSGETLDKKTPLLKSMESISTQALRIVKLFGNTTSKRVVTTVGPEQEYFLIDEKQYQKRKDLLYCNRTLFGAPAPKGHEMDDHYFGAIKPRINAYMKELDEELWRLGILAKTKHNEVAPAQHELAPIFTTTNIATDHNQLTMEFMKKVAPRHGLTCLLHEKPFAGINGSGKHNNWSIATDDGINLLEPGKSPNENAQFLLFLSAIIKAVDEYQDLLRLSVANAGNDHRLGANEAPPSIISIFLGDELTAILDAIDNGTAYVDNTNTTMKIGIHVLPDIPRDTTDRNRTSPFAFTGNKFEFRMVGSTLSISGPNIVLNAATSAILKEFADELEKAKNFNESVNAIVKRTIKEHKRIIFNGDGYSQKWQDEAAKRGLSNLKTSVDALPEFTSKKSISLFTKQEIFTEQEIRSRCDIMLEAYSMTINIEALTMVDMIKKDIIPAVNKYISQLSTEVSVKANVCAEASNEVEMALIKKLSALNSNVYKTTEKMVVALESSKKHNASALDLAKYYKDVIIPLMEKSRSFADELEINTSSKVWPFPTYGDLLFKI